MHLRYPLQSAIIRATINLDASLTPPFCPATQEGVELLVDLRNALAADWRNACTADPGYLWNMKKPLTEMTVKRVRQGSAEAGDSHVQGTMNERLVIMSQLSLSAWANTGRPFPNYRRSEIPVFKTTLGARTDRD